ncbi:MAG: hypothetical protein GX848_07255 [Clostridiales bacterium]|nr:hypothetical protein [Clostridiales bacterium]
MSICPTAAISMKEDLQGFLYPQINYDLCIECGKCLEVCDLKKPVDKENNPIKAYATAHKDKKVLSSSSSGGAFTLLSDIVLNNNGVIFGCKLDDKIDVYHDKAGNKLQRDLMRGSKYVQSDMKNTYKDIAALLKEGREVMFVGTPCQVAGLYSFLGKRPKLLTTVDFICHGVPSQKLLKDHVKFLENKYNKKAVNYLFRDKIYGWRHTETIVFSDNTRKSSYDTFRLKHLFLINIALRPACYSCKYTNYHRVSDITIGDFWRGEIIANNYKNLGISVMLINTEKGKLFNSSIKNTGLLKEIEISDTKQRALLYPAKLHDETNNFWKLYEKSGYETITEKYKAPKLKHYLRFSYVRFIVFFKLDELITYTKTKYRYLRKKRTK